MQTQRFHAYVALMRLNRPVGIWLLLWPCFWGVALASREAPSLWLLLLFTLGAALMRSAGCVVNDMADRHIDAQVERTKARPLASGALSLREAMLALMLLLAGALLVVLQLHPLLVYYAAASLLLVAAYPFMKRITYWPQAFLGLTFNLGAIFGWVAVQGAPDWPALLLYGAGICWTIGYDTIYAHQDIEDDISIGVKSTAIRFGAHNDRWIAGFYSVSALCFLLAIIMAGGGLFAYAAAAIMAAHYRWQCRRFTPKSPALALMLFKSNAMLGGIIALLLLADATLYSLLP